MGLTFDVVNTLRIEEVYVDSTFYKLGAGKDKQIDNGDSSQNIELGEESGRLEVEKGEGQEGQIEGNCSLDKLLIMVVQKEYL